MSEERDGPEDEDDGQYHLEFSCCSPSFINGCWNLIRILTLKKGKGLPQQAELAHGVPDRLRPRIFLTFGTTRVVGRQPYALAAFTPGEIPGTHF
jgi:hypothetical protein